MLYLHIFIDGSVNNQLKIGYGAYLVVSELGAAIESLKDTVRVKRFEHTNSTKLELQKRAKKLYTMFCRLSHLSR